jgi:hypothetical protein
MLTFNDVSYIRNETGKFLRDYYFPQLKEDVIIEVNEEEEEEEEINDDDDEEDEENDDDEDEDEEDEENDDDEDEDEDDEYEDDDLETGELKYKTPIGKTETKKEPQLPNNKTGITLSTILQSICLPGLVNANNTDENENDEIKELTLEISNECQSVIDDIQKGKKGRFDIISKEIVSTAKNISNYEEKPFVSQLICLWYIICTANNEEQGKIFELLKKEWKIKEDILAEMADTYVTLNELKENIKTIDNYMSKISLWDRVKNLFKKKKKVCQKLVFENEYKEDEIILLKSIKELIATETISE